MGALMDNVTQVVDTDLLAAPHCLPLVSRTTEMTSPSWLTVHALAKVQVPATFMEGNARQVKT
jgi:hypothetical protein